MAKVIHLTRRTAGETSAYHQGYHAGIEAAAKVCAERAVVERERAGKEMDEDACGRALSREASARYLAAAIRKLIGQAQGGTASAGYVSYVDESV